MKNKLISILALMLCVSALFLPVSAYASTQDDTEAPSLKAKIKGETLIAEASDRDSGVEAVYVNGHRFGYLVDGVVEVSPLRDYAGTDEYIVVQAIDYAGNKSKKVKLENPYYSAPTPEPEQTQTTPVPDPTPQPTEPPATSRPQNPSGGNGGGQSTTSRPSATPPASTPETTATPESTPAPTPEPSESSVPDGSSNPFTPDGTGSVQDNATGNDGKEFFTIVTEDENIFYLVIDRQRDSEGVYLLNTVTEDDLMALAEKSGSSGESMIPVPEPQPTPVQPEPTPEPEPEPEPPAENNTGMIIFVIIAALAVGGAGYYFKILRPKQQAALEDEEDEDDSGEYGEDYDDEDEYDFSDDDAEFLEDGDVREDEDGDPQ